MESLLLSGGKAEPEEVRLLDRMYQLRHTVFAERLKWTSLNNDRREIDLYDVLSPVYLICRDPAGEVVGCWRLLPTTGPYMLKDIFSHLLHGASPPEQPDIWEISRFAIDPQWRDYHSLGAVGSVTARRRPSSPTSGKSAGSRSTRNGAIIIRSARSDRSSVECWSISSTSPKQMASPASSRLPIYASIES
jgi:hypothetical protein